MAVTPTTVNNGDTGAVARAAWNGNDTDLAALANDNESRLTNAGISASGTTIDSVKLDITQANPIHQEGLLFYDKDRHTAAYYNDEAELELHIGHEMYLRVYNGTGLDITKGLVVQHSGVANGVPSVQLAIATSFEGATILGVAAHTIETGTYGYITFMGVISDINTSLLTAGLPAYLSDTIAGTMTNTPPQIISQVGGTLVSSASVGEFQVMIDNNRVRPTILGTLQDDTSQSYNLTAVPQAVVNYATSSSEGVVVDALLGTITIPITGKYRLSFTATMSFVSTTSTREVVFDLYDLTSATSIFPYVKNIPRNATRDSLSATALFDGTAGDVYEIRMSSTPDIPNFLVDQVSFEVESSIIT